MQEIITFLSHHLTLASSVAAALFLLVILETIRLKRRTTQLSPLQATQQINRENAVVIDIRSNELYRKGHIINALSIPAADITANKKKLEKFKTKLLIIVCATGVESQKTSAFLKKEGYNVHSLAGGLRAWVDADMPVIKDNA